VNSINDAEESVIPVGGKTFKALSGWNGHFDFAVFAYGENEMSRAACSMAAVALNAAKSYYEEKYDKVSFIKEHPSPTTSCSVTSISVPRSCTLRPSSTAACF